MKFLIDPKTKIESVSLTLLLISFAALIVAGVLEMFGKVDTVSIFEALFLTCSGLYWGRRIKLSKDTKELDKE